MSYNGQVKAQMNADIEFKIGRLSFSFRHLEKKPLKKVYELIENETGWNTKQIDAVIEGYEPKLKGYLDACLDKIQNDVDIQNSVMKLQQAKRRG